MRPQLASVLVANYNSWSRQILIAGSSSWPVPTLCRSQSWRTVAGRIRPACRSVEDGADTAPPPATRKRFPRKRFWNHSAISATQATAGGRRRSLSATRCVSPSPPRGGSRRLIRQSLRQCEFFASPMCMSATIDPQARESWNSMLSTRCGFPATRMPPFRRWRNVFWKLI